MAVSYDGGVIIGADSRTTTGSYIANRVTDKLTMIHDYIYCCRSGSAADTQAVADMVKYYLSLSAVTEGELPKVETAAALFQELCYSNKDSLSAGIIVAGWDEYDGPSVYAIPLGGSKHKLPFTIGGSGSTFIYGFCDSQFKENMTKEEAITFTRNAITLALTRDGSSGGVVRIASITKDGVERFVFSGDNLPKFYQS